MNGTPRGAADRLFLCLFLAVAVFWGHAPGPVHGCDANLLELVQDGIPTDALAQGLFDLASHATRLAGSLQTLPPARACFATLNAAWERIPPLVTPSPDRAPPPDLTSLASAVTALRQSIDREDLLTAHEDVKQVFFRALQLLARNRLPPPQEHILGAALHLQALQELALKRDFPAMSAPLEHLVPLIHALPTHFPAGARESAKNLDDLAQRLQATPLAAQGNEDRILIGVALLKEEFAVFLRSTVTGLASPLPGH